MSEIYSLMAKAIKAFGERGITKASTNSFQRFNYRSIDDTLLAANSVFGELGICITFSAKDSVFSRNIVQTAKGDRIDFTLQATYTVRFYAPDGSFVECTDLPAANTGQDDSKLAGQVMSYILKEALFKTFLIPTTGNDDIDGKDTARNQPGKAPNVPTAPEKTNNDSRFF